MVGLPWAQPVQACLACWPVDSTLTRSLTALYRLLKRRVVLALPQAAAEAPKTVEAVPPQVTTV